MIVLITGCSSGIGLATAVLLARKGMKVYASMRNLESKSRLEAAVGAKLEMLQLDVTDDSSVKRAVDAIIKKEGRIDVLINNAGYGLRGPVETVRIDEAKALFDVNFFGLMRVTQAVLPCMRQQKSGRIINISSIAGVAAKPDSDLYNASKFAVEAISEAMAPALSKWNVQVCVVEPGPVATDFPGRSLKRGSRSVEGNPYDKIISVMQAQLNKRFANAQKPEEVAQLIHHIITAEKPHFRYQTSDEVRQAVAKKLADVTGDAYRDEVLDSLSA